MTRITRTHWFDQLTMARRQLGRVVHDIAVGLEALHRVQFDEPWKKARRPTYGEW